MTDKKVYTIEVPEETIQNIFREAQRNYPGVKMKDPELFIKGVFHMLNQTISTNSVPSIDNSTSITKTIYETPLTVLLSQLVNATIESGSKGLEYPEVKENTEKDMWGC